MEGQKIYCCCLLLLLMWWPYKSRLFCYGSNAGTYARLWFSGPTESPWAWWWHAWRGWRTSWCLQTDQQGKPRLLLEEPSQLSSGNADRSWSLERFLAQDTGRAACGLAAQWISGNDAFHEEPLYQACDDEVSWLLQWQARSHELPFLASCFRGAFPPVDLRAVCFVRAIPANSNVNE